MRAFAEVFMSGLEEIRKSWGWFLVLGILLIVLGAVCIGTAQTATTASILVLGWILAISGAVWLVNALLASKLGRILIGYLLIRHPHAGAEGITLLLASLFEEATSRRPLVWPLGSVLDGAALVGFAGAIHRLPKLSSQRS